MGSQWDSKHRRLVIHQQNVPWRIGFQHFRRCSDFFVQQLGLDGGASTRSKRLYPNSVTKDALRDDDDIAHPDRVSGLPYSDSIEADLSIGAKTAGERAASC